MKKLLLFLILLINTILFLFYPTQAIEASKTGLLLWFYQIVPTLLPWTILSNVIIHSNLISNQTNTSTHIINKVELIVLFCGFLFGFPIGSKLTADFYQAGLLKKKRAQILCACSNQFSLSYISSFVLTQVLQLPDKQLQFFTLLYAPTIVLGLCMLIYDSIRQDSPKLFNHKKTASRFQINMQIIDAGIISGFEALIKLCGYIVMFSILVAGFQIILHKKIIPLLLINTLLETTSGIARLSDAKIPFYLKYLLCIASLNLGGISCLAQTGSILSKTDLSIGNYIFFKVVSTVLSIAITLIYLFIF